MLKIRTSQDEGFALVAISGRIEATCLSELQRCLDRTAKGAEVAIDLDEVTLVDRETVRFLAACEARGIQLKNCPSYVREWMETARGDQT